MRPKKLGRGLDSLLPRSSEPGKEAQPSLSKPSLAPVTKPQTQDTRPKTQVTRPEPPAPVSPPTKPDLPDDQADLPQAPTKPRIAEQVKPQTTKPIRSAPGKDIPTTEPGVNDLVYLNISEIKPNRFQPRKAFDPDSLNDLINSIKSAGVLQPILVRKAERGYEIVGGERRWRACKALKITRVPAIIREADDREMLEWALIENTQRQDLNPIERARAYKELGDHFELTHEEIADKVGLDRSTISNFVRLLDLPTEVQEDVSRGTVTMGHARCLLGIENRADQMKLLRRVKKEGLSVRRLENIIQWLKKPSRRAKAVPKEDLYLRELENRLRRKFGTKVAITHYKKRGYIKIDFYSQDDFQRIIETLGP